MKYEITKEQILHIMEWGNKKDAKMVREEWFPEAFKTVLEVGKWYKTEFVLINITNIDAKGNVYGYGWDLCSEIWHDSDNDYWGVDNATEATESEVFEALKKEALRRGLKEGCYFIEPKNAFMFSEIKRLAKGFIKLYNRDCNGLCFSESSSLIFKDGKWAEIIETITLNDAEKLLNKKII